jgi:hypothetical protein
MLMKSAGLRQFWCKNVVVEPGWSLNRDLRYHVKFRLLPKELLTSMDPQRRSLLLFRHISSARGCAVGLVEYSGNLA